VSAPDLPRFKVSSVTGYSLGAGSGGRSTAWYVLDTWFLHAVVASYLVGDASPARRRERAEQRCAELEAWHTEALANAVA
jgi:hypothetical protein